MVLREEVVKAGDEEGPAGRDAEPPLGIAPASLHRTATLRHPPLGGYR